MALRKAARRNERKREGINYHCSDCAHSYDWHSKALDGHLILCRCPYRQEGGKWCIFLNDTACNDHFKLRQTTDNAQAKE